MIIRRIPWISNMNGHGHDFGHEFVSESVSKADSDTRFFGSLEISDTDKLRSCEVQAFVIFG